HQTVVALEKGGVFARLVARVLLVVGGPVQLLVHVAVLSSVLFVVIALVGGSKPDFRLLAGVVLFAASVEVPRLLLRLLLISQLQVSRVEPSAAALVAAPQVNLAVYLLLRRLDPFEMWFWGLLGLGLWQTGQLRLRGAVVLVVVLALLAALWHGA